MQLVVHPGPWACGGERQPRRIQALPRTAEGLGHVRPEQTLGASRSGQDDKDLGQHNVGLTNQGEGSSSWVVCKTLKAE
jgi:hypothetical protein